MTRVISASRDGDRTRGALIDVQFRHVAAKILGCKGVSRWRPMPCR
jgi:hypothetical protein